MDPTEHEPPPPPLAQPGEIIGEKYRLDAIIGRGGMGEVWAATHTRLGTKVAVKLIGADHASSAEVRKRFHAEAQAAARLASKHVVQIFDSGERADGAPFIAMELLRGESLDQRLDRGIVPPHEAARILAQVCRALSRAHAAGIIHRDIKPENIFLSQTEDEDEPVVKLLDFGVAKLTDDLNSTASTRAGTLIGTPLYMSPEQARAKKDVDGRTDTYSVGIVMFYILTGTLPFVGETVPDLLIEICRGVIPRLSEASPQPLPPELDAWLEKACALDANDRFESPQALSEAFSIAVGSSIPMARLSHTGDWAVESAVRGPASSKRLGKPSHVATLSEGTSSIPAEVRAPRRRRIAAAAVAVAGVIAAVGFVGYRGHAASSRVVPSAAAPPPPTVLAATPPPPASAAPVVSAAAPEPPPVDTAAAAPTASPSSSSSVVPTVSATAPRKRPPPPTATTKRKPAPIDLGY